MAGISSNFVNLLLKCIQHGLPLKDIPFNDLGLSGVWETYEFMIKLYSHDKFRTQQSIFQGTFGLDGRDIVFTPVLDLNEKINFHSWKIFANDIELFNETFPYNRSIRNLENTTYSDILVNLTDVGEALRLLIINALVDPKDGNRMYDEFEPIFVITEGELTTVSNVIASASFKNKLEVSQSFAYADSVISLNVHRSGVPTHSYVIVDPLEDPLFDKVLFKGNLQTPGTVRENSQLFIRPGSVTIGVHQHG